MNRMVEQHDGIRVQTYVSHTMYAVPLSVRLQCAWTHDECVFVELANGHFKSFEGSDYVTSFDFVEAVVNCARFAPGVHLFANWRDRILT